MRAARWLILGALVALALAWWLLEGSDDRPDVHTVDATPPAKDLDARPKLGRGGLPDAAVPLRAHPPAPSATVELLIPPSGPLDTEALRAALAPLVEQCFADLKAPPPQPVTGTLAFDVQPGPDGSWRLTNGRATLSVVDPWFAACLEDSLLEAPLNPEDLAAGHVEVRLKFGKD